MMISGCPLSLWLFQYLLYSGKYSSLKEIVSFLNSLLCLSLKAFDLSVTARMGWRFTQMIIC